MKFIPFNKPYLSGKETDYINEAVNSGKISGNGMFTKKCQDFFEQRYGFKKTLLTTSCTDALEMCAILAEIKPGDEVIAPGFTFVSSALAFVRQGAKIVFADSRTDNPNIDVSKIEALITPKTKAIVVVHYGGIACEMDEIMALANEYKLLVIEDAAHSIDSFYKGKALGSIGHFATFSFHESKNIIAGEGGMLVINDERFIARAEIIWDKGTNRSAFFRGEIDKYNWVDTGSSFLPSEIISAFLWAQLENIENIQQVRTQHWNRYYNELKTWSEKQDIQLPEIPDYATNNSHVFYLICKDETQRNKIIEHLKKDNILAVFHYQSLQNSPYYSKFHDGRILENSDRYSDGLLRLPLFYELDIERVINSITKI